MPKTGRPSLLMAFALCVVIILGQASFAWAETPAKGDIPTPIHQTAVKGAIQGLKVVVDLWRLGRFSDLYEWGTEESRHRFSKEQFIKFMKHSSRQLLCCWATVQDLQALLKSPTQVYVQAKLGYRHFRDATVQALDENAESVQWVVSSSFDPQTFLMVLQQDRWRIDLTEVLLASGYLPETLW